MWAEELPSPGYGDAGTNVSGTIWSDHNEELYICYLCNQTGGCQLGYDGSSRNPSSEWVIVGVLNTGYIPYNPWTDPTLVTNVRNSTTQVKPDGSMTVFWDVAHAGQGNSIGKYSCNFARYRNGSWSNRMPIHDAINPVANHWDFSISELNDKINIRPGDLLRFDVDTWIDSQTAGHSSGWYGERYSSNNDVTVYKDGLIQYKDNNGSIHEGTKGYYKDNSGNINKLRYGRVKDSSGNTRIIDIYTTRYE